jgi:hypothetical protein
MNCSDCQNLLSDYIDGDLNTDKQAMVRIHLSSCGECRSILQDLQRIINMSEVLPQLAASDLTWRSLEKEVQHLTAVSRWKRFWHYRMQFSLTIYHLAVTIALLLAGGVVMVKLLNSPLQSTSTPITSPTSLTSRPLTNSINPEEAELRSAIDHLSQAITQHRSGWDKDMEKVFERNLAIVDRSVADCRQFLMRNPDDPVAHEMMLTAYKEKLRLLEQFSSLNY